MRNRALKHLKFFAKLGITFLALYYVFSNVDLKNLLFLLFKADIMLVATALLLFVFSKIVSAIRLNLYFNKIGVSLSERYNIKLYLLCMFYNLFLPGGIGGDGYKVYFINKKIGVGAKRIFWAVLLDRLIGLLALFCLAVLFFYFVPVMVELRPFCWISILLAVSGSYFLTRYFFSDFAEIFIKTGVQSILVQISQVFSAFFILRSLNVDDHNAGYLFVFLLSSVVSVIPLTIGGIGSRELVFAVGSRWIGLDMDLSIALSLVFYFITALTSLSGMVFIIKPDLLKESAQASPCP